MIKIECPPAVGDGLAK